MMNSMRLNQLTSSINTVIGSMMKKFDPFGWMERYFSAHTLHLAIRGIIVAVLLVFLAHRIISYSQYGFKPLWVVETLIFVVFLISYIIRKEPVDRSRGVREIVIPLIGGVLPFSLLFSPPHPLIFNSIIYVRTIFIVMTAATALTLWGLWTLKRSFSITVEARELVTVGPFRFIRHPIYLGELITALAVSVWRLSAANIILFILFFIIQLYRSRMEEAKLARIFPDYQAFAIRSLWFWPAMRKPPE